MDRKEFLKMSCGLCGISVLGTSVLLESCNKNTSGSTTPQGPTVNFTLDLTKPVNASLNSPGGSLPSNGVIVVCTTLTSYYAIAQTCTHAGCSINYDKNGNDFVCPCHGATYDTNGNVTGGPAPAPLKKYTVTKNGNILTVAG